VVDKFFILETDTESDSAVVFSSAEDVSSTDHETNLAENYYTDASNVIEQENLILDRYPSTSLSDEDEGAENEKSKRKRKGKGKEKEKEKEYDEGNKNVERGREKELNRRASFTRHKDDSSDDEGDLEALEDGVEYRRIWEFNFLPLGFFGRLIVRTLEQPHIKVIIFFLRL